MALAERLAELREEKRYLEGQIETVSADLAAGLGEGVTQVLGALEVRVAPAREGLRIANADEVPERFLSPKPDRQRLLEHIRSTGEVPAGVEVRPGRPIVYVKESRGR